MLAIKINGENSGLTGDSHSKFADIIELIKAQIDPEHMITTILLDGRDVAEDEWYMVASQIKAEALEVTTGRPETFVAERIREASGVVRQCYLEFRDARKGFQDGEMQDGNRKLKVAVDTLRAFFEWYGTLLQLVPEDGRDKLDISPQIREISEVCKRICQQQLYQSWWALGESLEKDLEPKLDKLEDVCRRVVKHVEAPAMQ